MELKEIRQLVKMVETSDISEIEIEESGNKIRITKRFASSNGEVHFMQAPQAMPGQIMPMPPTDSSAQLAPMAAPSPAPAEQLKPDNVIEVRSPMVGTFYSAPSPDADPYVSAGSAVSVGQTMCIIEAMKLMNEIEAETAGKIIDIFVENAQPVEYNQVMFTIEKA